MNFWIKKKGPWILKIFKNSKSKVFFIFKLLNLWNKRLLKINQITSQPPQCLNWKELIMNYHNYYKRKITSQSKKYVLWFLEPLLYSIVLYHCNRGSEHIWSHMTLHPLLNIVLDWMNSKMTYFQNEVCELVLHPTKA